MKRIALLLLILALVLSAAGCGASPERADEPLPSAPVQMPEPTAPPAASPAPDPTTSPAQVSAASAAPDVDLTVLSSTMVYGEVYAMLNEPDAYRGKSVRMSGSFAVNEWEGKRYFACIVQDATACCAQGLEFEREGSPVYPDEYPALGAEITVTGIFDTYWEDAPDGKSYEYVYLREARLE